LNKKAPLGENLPGVLCGLMAGGWGRVVGGWGLEGIEGPVAVCHLHEVVVTCPTEDMVAAKIPSPQLRRYAERERVGVAI